MSIGMDSKVARVMASDPSQDGLDWGKADQSQQATDHPVAAVVQIVRQR